MLQSTIASKQFERTYVCCIVLASVLLLLTQHDNYMRIFLAYMFMPIVALQYFAAIHCTGWGFGLAIIVYVTVMAAAFSGIQQHYVVATIMLLIASTVLLVLHHNTFKQALICVACALLGRSCVGAAAIIALLTAASKNTDMNTCAGLPPV